MAERRRFSGRERTALYLAAGGRCAECGTELEPGWHADHVDPYSRSRNTDVTNGQALCPPCNLRKGASVALQPRGWQRRFIAKYHGHTGSDFLCVACPGAGKTLAAAFVARDLLADGVIERLLIVVPSVALRMQWHGALSKVGILVDGWTMNNGDGEQAEADGRRIQGWVVAYQSLDAAAETHRILNSRKRTMAILDEVHHLSTDGRWGMSAIDALEPCARRLMLSGTPFRSKGDQIPFVEYVDDWCRYRDDPDRPPYPYPQGFDYSYGVALGDKDPATGKAPVRPVIFEPFGGDVAWLDDGASEESEVDISDATLNKATRRKAARHILNPAGEWLTDVLRAADQRLSAVRSEGDPQAKGLVICINTAHAEEVANKMRAITGTDFVHVAVSKDGTGRDVTEDARKVIEGFGKNSARWLVAVAMVSEGVDIPQLRVGVYATTVRTQMFFRQALGRFVRMRDDLPAGIDQTAHLFIPKEKITVELADNVLNEVKQALLQDDQDDDDQDDDGKLPGGGGGAPEPLPFDAFRRSSSRDPQLLLPGLGSLDPALVEQIAREEGEPASKVASILAKAIDHGIPLASVPTDITAPAAEQDSYVGRRDRKRSDLETLLRQITGAYLRKHGGSFGEVISRLKMSVYSTAGIYTGNERDTKERNESFQRADIPALNAAVQGAKKLWSEM